MIEFIGVILGFITQLVIFKLFYNSNINIIIFCATIILSGMIVYLVVINIVRWFI